MFWTAYAHKEQSKKIDILEKQMGGCQFMASASPLGAVVKIQYYNRAAQAQGIGC